MTLIGSRFLAEFFVYVFTNFDWLTLDSFFDLQFLQLNRQPISDLERGKTLPHGMFLTNQSAYAGSLDLNVSVYPVKIQDFMIQGELYRSARSTAFFDLRMRELEIWLSVSARVIKTVQFAVYLSDSFGT